MLADSPADGTPHILPTSPKFADITPGVVFDVALPRLARYAMHATIAGPRQRPFPDNAGLRQWIDPAKQTRSES